MASTDATSRLYVKSFFAASVEEAMERARTELGPDALLLNMREAPAEARHLGEFEVVFGLAPGTAPARGPEAPADPVADLRVRVEELHQLVSRAVMPARREPAGSALVEALTAADISRPIAYEIDAAVGQRLRGSGVIEIGRPARTPSTGGTAEIVRATVEEIESRFSVDSKIGRIAAVVGPAGAGKTTVLVKLAVAQGLAARRPVRLCSIDHHRIGAADQLRTYAAILGVPFVLAETSLALEQAIDSAPPDCLVLIDTPGHTRASLLECGQELAEFFERRQDIDTHLVLTASMRHADMRAAADRFRAFQPKKLLFTHLDETDAMGAIFCEAARSGNPLSFFSTGQLIPEDLEPAAKPRITDCLVRELPQALEAVA
jgi:flagellar biosynthesis protein FlhF